MDRRRMSQKNEDREEDPRKMAVTQAKELMVQQGNPGKLVKDDLLLIIDRVHKATGVKISTPDIYKIQREASKEYEEDGTKKFRQLEEDSKDKVKKAVADNETLNAKLNDLENERLKLTTENDSRKRENEALHQDIQKINGDIPQKVSDVTAKIVNEKRDSDKKYDELKQEHSALKDKDEELNKRLNAEYETNEVFVNINRILEERTARYQDMYVYSFVALIGFASYVALYLSFRLPGITERDVPALTWLPFLFSVFYTLNVLVDTYLHNIRSWIGVAGSISSVGFGLSLAIMLPHFFPILVLNRASDVLLLWIVPAFAVFNYLYARDLLHKIAVRNQI